MLKGWQKLNHFPGMNILCWKNSLSQVISKMKSQFGKEFDFVPKTYLLPDDNDKLEADEKRYKNEGRKF